MYVLMGLESLSFLADFFSERADLLTLGLLAGLMRGLLFWGLRAVSQLVLLLGSRGEQWWITDSGLCTNEGNDFKGLREGSLSCPLGKALILGVERRKNCGCITSA